MLLYANLSITLTRSSLQAGGINKLVQGAKCVLLCDWVMNCSHDKEASLYFEERSICESMSTEISIFESSLNREM